MRASAHHLIRKLFAVGTTIVALGVLVPVASAGHRSRFISRRSATPDALRRHFVELQPIPAGTEINYSGPDTTTSSRC